MTEFAPPIENQDPGLAFFAENGLSEIADVVVTYTDAAGTTHTATAQEAASACAPFRSQLEMLGPDLAEQVIDKMKASTEQVEAYAQKKRLTQG
jgi:hypothetical protein